MSRKIVINTCFGGIGLSEAAARRLAERKGTPFEPSEFSFYPVDVPRDDPDLVAVVAELGKEAGGVGSRVVIVEIPDDVKWHIEEYDGLEHVAEDHRTWFHND